MIEKIARISYNSEGWRFPTGQAAKIEAKTNYNPQFGFGHEDWLFRDEWQIEGWRYAFLQGATHIRKKFVKDQVPFNVTLFTVYPNKSRKYVARILGAECLSDIQATDALNFFKDRGWFGTMTQEVSKIKGVVGALGEQTHAWNILNIRYRLECVQRFNIEMQPSDPFINRERYSHYMFFDRLDKVPHIDTAIEEIGRKHRSGDSEPGSYLPYFSTYFQGGLRNPEHIRMQAQLMQALKKEYPLAVVKREENFVDLIVRTENKEILFEIKTSLSPRTVIREALGQLLEYGHYYENRIGREIEFVAVGRKAMSGEDINYLTELRHRYNLPISYRAVEIG